MKNAIAGIAVLLVAGTTSAFAEDGRVTGTTLSAIGLDGMQVVSDAEGMEVRGMSSSAMSMGTSLVFGQIIDPHTKSFVVGSDVNTAKASSYHYYLPSIAKHSQNSNVLLGLQVGSFSGVLAGSAGGSGFAFGN